MGVYSRLTLQIQNVKFSCKSKGQTRGLLKLILFNTHKEVENPESAPGTKKYSLLMLWRYMLICQC